MAVMVTIAIGIAMYAPLLFAVVMVTMVSGHSHHMLFRLGR